MKKLGMVAVALCLMLGSAHAAETVKIGLMGPMTGSWASEGQEMKQVLDLLAEELNAKGGIGGKKVEVVIVNDDIALPDIPQPRGIAGGMFVEKVAGHYAEK